MLEISPDPFSKRGDDAKERKFLRSNLPERMSPEKNNSAFKA
jgi:hypothetical protein